MGADLVRLPAMISLEVGTAELVSGLNVESRPMEGYLGANQQLCRCGGPSRGDTSLSP
ncbi:protein of unknown function [Methanoculleus bourgensis]|uniref:Uncharacterized protein n=1 Tax=Methanoculleus bourgensis TaxID=83986 RepID=A0A0X3BH62_9EURY|nr:protein of unknown function [Methanoculleus bourgensis]